MATSIKNVYAFTNTNIFKIMVFLLIQVIGSFPFLMLLWPTPLLFQIFLIAQLTCFILYNRALINVRIEWLSEANIPDVASLAQVHKEWKDSFQKTIEEKLPMDSRQVGNPHICKLGHWMIANVGQYKFLKSYADLAITHENFHKEAKRIAILLNNQVYAAAEQALCPGSDYDESARLVEEALHQLLTDISKIERKDVLLASRKDYNFTGRLAV